MAPKSINRSERQDALLQQVQEYVLKFGIDAFSTNAFIKYFNMGKSSLYSYFTSKDEIIYALYYKLALADIQQSQAAIRAEMDLMEKLEIVFDFYLKDDFVTVRFRQLYHELLQIRTDKRTETMYAQDAELMAKTQMLLKTVFEQEVAKKHIRPESESLITSLIVTADGMLLYAFSLEDFDLVQEFRAYLEGVVTLIGVDKS